MGTGRMDKNSHDSLRVGAGNDDKVNEDWFLEDNTSQMALVPYYNFMYHAVSHTKN